MRGSPPRRPSGASLVSERHEAQGERAANDGGRAMKTVYYTATSLDGYIADEQSSLGWLFQFSADPGESDEGYETFAADVGAIVMGSSTYEWVLAEEIKDDPGRWPYAQPTWVFSSRDLHPVPGADIRFASGPVAVSYTHLTLPTKA